MRYETFSNLPRETVIKSKDGSQIMNKGAMELYLNENYPFKFGMFDCEVDRMWKERKRILRDFAVVKQ